VSHLSNYKKKSNEILKVVASEIENIKKYLNLKFNKRINYHRRCESCKKL